jgi:2-amino-4-hydroxy-6-hydroxymethyldihydropteridine diphosphokinase
MATVFLSLGSNLGDRREHIERGTWALEQGALSHVKRSAFYETEPIDLEDQPWFINQVVRGETRLSPTELLAECKRIERAAGRTPTVRFGPRTLDIDILLYGRLAVEREGLVIPHPRMRERRFVLIPLLEIAPELTDPRDGEEYAKALERLDEGKKVLPSLLRES